MREAIVRHIEDIEPWLEELWDHRGTDLLLTSETPPMIRVDGNMRPVTGGTPLSADLVESLVHSVMGEHLVERFIEDREIDFAFSWQDRARLRCNAFHQRETCSLALRMIPYEIPTFDELGLPEVVERLVALPMGFVIVTGPTGSGKSTSLAAMLDWINKNRQCHIVTIEDPIEYVHQNHLSAVSQREVGSDTHSFHRALRSVLREDPDVLLVGEMRDLESIATAITIAETGHLVFATLHTNDSAQALDRIVDIFPSDRRDQIQVQLSSVLEGVIYQRLVRRKEGGLVAAYEVLTANHAVRNLVREGKTRQLRNVITTHQSEGMRTLEMALSQLVQDDVIEYEEALGVSMYPKEVEKKTPDHFALAAAMAAANGADGSSSGNGLGGATSTATGGEPPRVAST
ncbi:MAG: type IV pilus twitching motility protein PilT [Actinomycetota bacterium]|nr:type IV pilus twitching motility protein PilT [Actinomycetota bacterium]